MLKLANQPLVDGILADLGLSTNQLFDSQYGLSFAAPMPLDMRIDPRTRRSAADLVNNLPEEELANVLYNLADERYSRRIARKIADARRQSPINTTDRLADLVRSAIPFKPGPPDRIDPATRSFMALRMAVNDEVGNLQRLLEQAPKFSNRAGDWPSSVSIRWKIGWSSRRFDPQSKPGVFRSSPKDPLRLRKKNSPAIPDRDRQN